MQQKKRLQLLLPFILLGMFICAYANVKPLPIDQAFRLTATARDNQTIVVIWHITPRYFLYRNHLHFKILKPKDAELGPILKPPGSEMTYPGLGTYEVYHGITRIALPVIQSSHPDIVLQVQYQGCSEDGFCYPPSSKIIAVDLAGPYGRIVHPLEVDIATPVTHPQTTATHLSFADQLKQNLKHAINSGNILFALLLFFFWGALVSLTPCIYPMVPILSSIIIGQKKITHGRSFLLSVSYVLGLAVTIAVVGLIISLLGYNLQTALQKPWVIITFSLFIIAMALSLFGLYNLQLPATLRNRLAHASDHQQRGTLWGAFVMGIFSMLIASPCATPPFFFALVVISQSGHIDVGTLGLFFMGIGMGLPLLVVGAFGGKILPKAGGWMSSIKNVMGILMLATAIWMLSSVFSSVVIMYLWAALVIGIAVYFGAFNSSKTMAAHIKKAIGILIFIYGIALLIGAIKGQTDPLQPLNLTEKTAPTKISTLKFIPVHSLADIQKILAEPSNQNKPVLLDFYAKWCKDCVVMDKFTFENPKVEARLKHYVLLRADVTDNTAADQRLQKQFGVIVPPAFVFYNRQHHEVIKARHIGMLSANGLLQHLNRFKLP